MNVFGVNIFPVSSDSVVYGVVNSNNFPDTIFSFFLSSNGFPNTFNMPNLLTFPGKVVQVVGQISWLIYATTTITLDSPVIYDFFLDSNKDGSSVFSSSLYPDFSWRVMPGTYNSIYNNNTNIVSFPSFTFPIFESYSGGTSLLPVVRITCDNTDNQFASTVVRQKIGLNFTLIT